MKGEALYPFGYGLSYTNFEIHDIIISSKELTIEGITVKGVLTNAGTYAGSEALQVYVRAKRENVPNRQLKALKKIFLKSGESRAFEFYLKPEDFALYNQNAQKTVEIGTYCISLGGSQPDSRSEALTNKKVWTTEIVAREVFYEF